MVIKIEENNDIFYAGGDAVVHLAKPKHKKYSKAFVWGHSFSMYVSYDRFLNPPSSVRNCAHFGRHHLHSPNCVRT